MAQNLRHHCCKFHELEYLSTKPVAEMFKCTGCGRDIMSGGITFPRGVNGPDRKPYCAPECIPAPVCMKTIDAHLSALMFGIARRRSADDETYLRDFHARLQKHLGFSNMVQKYLSHSTDCACPDCKRVRAVTEDMLAHRPLENVGIDSSFCLAMANTYNPVV